MEFLENGRRIIVLGDIHGSFEALERELEKEDVGMVIQCGDFGMIWNGENESLFWMEYLYSDKWIIFVAGNHENYDRLETYPIVYLYGARCRQIRRNVLMVERGEIMEINGKTYLFMGGADSIDRAWRLALENQGERKCWWAQEQITKNDIDNALHNAEKYGYKVNYVITHGQPYFFLYEQGYANSASISYASALMLQDLAMAIDFDMWYSGHLHDRLYSNFRNKNIRVLGIDEVSDLEAN